MTNILPENVKAGARGMQQFFVKYMSFPLMITVGIGRTSQTTRRCFTNPAYIVIIMATVIGAMIGTFIVGKLFHFYHPEGMRDCRTLYGKRRWCRRRASVSALRTAWS